MIPAVKTEIKTGHERFLFDGRELPIDILSFWKWNCSELLGNALRGKLAEFIIASALGLLDKPREEWDFYDLETKRGLKIEVKSSSYLQSWEQEKLSKISFGIKPTGESQTLGAPKSRKSDIYIFCVLSHREPETVNPIDLSQWNFYVLETSVLNEKLPTQQTITLSSLLELKPKQIRYNEIRKTIELLEEKLFK